MLTVGRDSASPARVLVVEDEIIIALGIQQTLQDLGYDVPEIAIREDEVEDKVRRLKPDLVLMDMNLSGARDGVDVATALGSLSDVPVVFLTAYVDQDTIERAQAAGSYGYLVKPYEAPELHSTLQMVLARSRALREVRRNGDWLLTCLNAISDGVVLLDSEARVRFLNRAAASFSMADGPAALGSPLSDVLSFSAGADPVEPLATVRRCLESGQEARSPVTLTVRIPGRERRSVLLAATPVRDSARARSGVVLLLQDVTDELAREEERNRLTNLEALGRLAGGIAHDFNNLLTVIVANLSMLRFQAEEFSELGPQLDQIELATTRAAEIANRFLTFSRGGAPRVRPLEVHDLIAAALAELPEPVRARIEVLLEPGLPALSADEQQMLQTLRALLSNALEAIAGVEGGRVVVAANFVPPEEVTSGPGRVRLTVSDTGAGVAEEVIPRLFEPYFSTKPGRLGLGLSTVHSIARRHGGQASIESRIGHGTTITLLLPPDPGRAASAEARSPAPPAIAGGQAGGVARALVMDDEELLRSSVRRMLETLGLEVSTAADGEEMLALYKVALDEGRPYDAVFLDLIVPHGMGGEEAVRQLKKLDPKAVAVVSSGYSAHPVISQYAAFGFSAVLQKPFGLAQLRAVLREVRVLVAGEV